MNNAAPSWLDAARAANAAERPVELTLLQGGEDAAEAEPVPRRSEVASESDHIEAVPAAVTEAPEIPTTIVGEAQPAGQIPTAWEIPDYAATGSTGSAAGKLASSAVAPLVAMARGYESLDSLQALTDAGKRLPMPGKASQQGVRMSEAVQRGDLLIMPWFTHDDIVQGEKTYTPPKPATVQLKPAKPESDAKGLPRKYEFASGRGTPIGMHPAIPTSWIDKTPVVLIAEGLLKGDSALTGYLLANGCKRDDLSWTDDDTTGDRAADVRAARAKLSFLLERIDPDNRVLILTIGGVDNWKNNPEWRTIRLNGRIAWLGIDGDVEINRNVHRAANELWDFLKKKKAKPSLLAPTVIGGDGNKVGIDDYLAKYGDWHGLLAMKRGREALAKAPAKPQSIEEKAREAAVSGYTIRVDSGVIEVPDVAVCEEIAGQADAYPTTFLGFASRTYRHWGQYVRWCPSIKAWRVWTGTYWVIDREGSLVKGFIFSTMRSILVHEAGYAERRNEIVIEAERRVEVAKSGGLPTTQFEVELAAARKAARAELEDFGRRCEDQQGSVSRALDMLKDRCSDLKTGTVWDWHELRVNAPNGTYDVMDRELRAHSPEDFITKILPVDIDLDAMTDDVAATLVHIERQRPGMRKTITRWSGLCLTKATDARAALAIEGVSGAAKSTWFQALMSASRGPEGCSYGVTLDASAIKAKRGSAGHSDALDRLAGATWAWVDECQGITVDAELLKKMISGSSVATSAKGISTREWDSILKLVLISNGPFRFPADDAAFAGRIIPETFGVRVPDDERDGHLFTRMKSHLDNLRAVIAVSLRAVSDWYEEKVALAEEGVVNAPWRALGLDEDTEAKQQAFAERVNPLKAFLEDVAYVGEEEDLKAKHRNLGRADTMTWCAYYNTWATRHGRYKMNDDIFAEYLNALGHGTSNPTEMTWKEGSTKVYMRNRKFREGIRFASQEEWLLAVDRYIVRQTDF